MTHPFLEDAYAKLGRAAKHLHDLKALCAEYSIGEPEGLAAQFEPQVPEEGNRPGVTVRVTLQTQPSPSISLIAGDVIQNTRSALDHLANVIVIRNRGIPTHKTQFPIFTDRLGFQGGIRKVEFEPQAAVLANTMVERLQPYHRVDDPTLHPFAILQELSNIDKHRRLHVVGGYAGDIDVTVGTRFFTLRVAQRAGGLAEHGTLVAFVPAEIAPSVADVKAEMRHSIQVGLKEVVKGWEAPLDELLDDLLNFMREMVIDRFCRRVFRATPPPANVFGL